MRGVGRNGSSSETERERGREDERQYKSRTLNKTSLREWDGWMMGIYYAVLIASQHVQ